jgi:hypothetical protein
MIKKVQPSEELKRFFGHALAKRLAMERNVTTIQEAANLSDDELLSVRLFGKIALNRLRTYQSPVSVDINTELVEALKRLIEPAEHCYACGRVKSFDELSFAIMQAKAALSKASPPKQSGE